MTILDVIRAYGDGVALRVAAETHLGGGADHAAAVRACIQVGERAWHDWLQGLDPDVRALLETEIGP